LYYKVLPETGRKDFTSCQTPRLIDFLFGKYSKSPWHVSVNIEKFSLLSIGISRRNLERWLEKVWFRKDAVITQYINEQINDGMEETNRGEKSRRFFRHKKLKLKSKKKV
jgi:hypothetical protein